MIKNQKIRYRILLGYSIPLILFIFVAMIIAASIRSFEKVHENAERLHVITAKANQVSFHIAKMQRSARGYLLIKDETSRNSYAAAKKGLDEVTQSLSILIKDEKQKELFGKISEITKKIIGLTDSDLLLVDQGKQNKAVEIFQKGESVKLERDLQALADEFEKNEEKLQETWSKEEDRVLERIVNSLWIGILLFIILSVAIGIVMTNSVTKPVSGAVAMLTSTSTEIAATVSQHERTASQQAAMVNETTTTMDELGASSRQTFDQASSAAEVAQRTLKLTGEGTAIVRQAIDGMNNLGDKIGMVADQIVKLGEQTAQIGNLANVVKDLSVEINMLALNAAVEAARAGEHGKGFAVVAGEVRKLANESKKSAEQANAIILNIQKSTNATIMKTEEGTRVVEEVSGFARNVDEVFTTLSEASNTVYENAQQLLLNAKQQSTAIGQVVEAMNGLNTGARETAAGISQTKTGLEQLNNAAQNLKQMV